MHVTKFHVRSLMFVIWLSALLIVGAVDVFKKQRMRNKVEIISESVNADGSSSATLISNQRTDYYIGPIAIGHYPIAVLSGTAFAASILIWALWPQGE